MHQFTRGIHVQFFNPALELCRHVRQRRFVVINRADRADGPAQRAACDFRCLEVHHLDCCRVNGDGEMRLRSSYTGTMSMPMLSFAGTGLVSPGFIVDL